MLKRFQRSLAALLMFLMAVAFTATPAKAGMLYNAKVTLTNPVASASTSYTFSMKVKSTGTIKGIKLSFLKAPSGSTQNPTDTDIASASTVNGLVGISGTWTTEVARDAGTDVIYMLSAGGGEISADTTIGWAISSIGNPGISNTNTGCNLNTTNASSGTCFIEVITFNTDELSDLDDETSSKIIDKTVIGFTVVAQATVSATVDPTLMFTVAPVAEGANINDAGTATTAAAASTYDTLPFGYMTVNTPKVMGHSLYVKTNANNGYTVTVKATTDTDAEIDGVMKGVYSGNNIDGFSGNGSNWTTATAWTHPGSTTANTDSGYLGVNSSDTGVSTFSGGASTGYSPLQNLVANTIMTESGPDLGTTATTITYGLEVNVYQPADVYSGTIQYNCVPVY